MQNQLFQTSSMIEAVSTRADNTYKIIAGTPELTPEQAAALFGLKGRQGWLLFKENPIIAEELPNTPADGFKREERPLEALNRCLYVFWDKCTGKQQPFNEFLRGWVNKKKQEILDHIPK